MINSSLTPTSPPNIIFECSDLRNDIGLMVTKNNENDNDSNNDFQLHLYDGYNDFALVMNINLRDFANMFDALGPYFHKEEQQKEEGIEL